MDMEHERLDGCLFCFLSVFLHLRDEFRIGHPWVMYAGGGVWTDRAEAAGKV